METRARIVRDDCREIRIHQLVETGSVALRECG